MHARQTAFRPPKERLAVDMGERVVVIDYGSGNLRSVARSLAHVARESGLSCEIIVSSRIEDVRQADRVVLPGVGAFGDCRRALDTIPGMVATLHEVAFHHARPFLGICVGMQLMATCGLEHGHHDGFNWFSGMVMPIDVADTGLKVPHMGWNALILSDRARTHPLFTGIKDGDHAYFVHSYHMVLEDSKARLASVMHGVELTAVIGEGAIAGVQFHPEKSQIMGLRFLQNFLEWRP